MAIDKYSGLSQSDKFYARYGKALGKNAVNRQQTHLASEAIKNETRAALQVPNYAASAQKSSLKLPNLAGGVYDRFTPKSSAVSDIVGETQKLTAQKLERESTQAAKALESVKKACDGKISVGISEARNSTLDKMACYYKNLEKESAQAAKGAKVLEGVKKACDGKISVGICETRNSELDKMAYYYKNLEKEAAEAAKPKGIKGYLIGLSEKLKAFAKTPKGKIGLAAAAVASVIGTGIYLYARNKDYGGPISDSSPINDLANMPAQGKINADGSYTVAKGDNLWCISRSILLELHKDEKDYKPTDVEIMQYMESIMQANNLKYEEGSYKVIIQPNQSLKLTA